MLFWIKPWNNFNSLQKWWKSGSHISEIEAFWVVTLKFMLELRISSYWYNSVLLQSSLFLLQQNYEDVNLVCRGQHSYCNCWWHLSLQLHERHTEWTDRLLNLEHIFCRVGPLCEEHVHISFLTNLGVGVFWQTPTVTPTQVLQQEHMVSLSLALVFTDQTEVARWPQSDMNFNTAPWGSCSYFLYFVDSSMISMIEWYRSGQCSVSTRPWYLSQKQGHHSKMWSH